MWFVGTGAHTRAVAAMAAVAVAAASVALMLPGTARADSAPAPTTATDPVTVSADALPTVQINGVAWSQVVVGTTVYVAGSFSRVRPAGSPAGTDETVRNNLLAYDIRTGQLVASFAPSLNAQALAVTASPDGSRLYVGGDFTVADGQPRNRIAAYDTRTGALVGSFRPSVNGQVGAIAATDTKVYLGGSLSGIGGVSRSRLAAVRASDGGLLPWAPVPGTGPTSGNRNPDDPTAPGSTATSNVVMGLVVTGGGSQVVASGRFDTMNGVKATGVAALDPESGATRTFEINRLITNQGVNSAVWSLSTDGTVVYGTGYDYYGPGNLEGSFAVDAANGRVRWIADCRGDTYSSFPANGVVYLASHAHSCVNIGGFPEQEPRVENRATAMSAAPASSVGVVAQSNLNFTGQPAPAVLNWYPSLAQGNVTGQYQAAWSVSGNNQYVVYGGEFPRVNGRSQQGLVRFAVPSLAPNKMGPTASGGVTATAIEAGTVRVAFLAASDPDNGVLSYSVYRDGGAAPVATFSRPSSWWSRPMLGWTDRGVPTGTHSYRLVAADAFGNSVDLGSTSVAVSGTGTARSYASTVHADGAIEHWSLGERSGSTAFSAAGAGDAAITGGARTGWDGALRGDPDTSLWFDGGSGLLSQQTAVRGLDTFSVEAWFETRTTSGGVLVDFGDVRSGISRNNDRQIWLDTAGRVNFGVYPDAPRIVTSPAAYNNGTWHHVVGSVSSGGMKLYVDGNLVASRTDTFGAFDINGYWHIGGDRPWSGTAFYNGRIDEVAVYPAALTPEQVARHHALGTTGAAPNAAPTASFTTGVQDLTASVDGRASTDPDGTIRSHGWDFGDGTTGSGATAAHTYSRSGTYTIRLTVTDTAGATATTERQVTVVEPPNRAPTASFTSTSSGLVASVDGRGSADADGTITSYSWAWGDSTAASSGATATHTYAAAGTYQVTLTVIDDDGATTSITRGVAVAAPGSSPPVAADTFSRTVTGGLGTAELGGSWTATVGASRQSVSGGTAVLSLPGAGNEAGAYLSGVGVSSADVRSVIRLSSVPTGNGTYAEVTGRRVSSGEQYSVRVRVAPDGAVYLALSRVTGNVESFPGGETRVAGLSWKPGTALATRVQVSGAGTTTVTGSVWVAGQAEPAAPQLSRTDTAAALQSAGAIGIGAYRPGNSTAATTVTFDDLQATVVGATPPPPPPAANAAPAASFTAQATDLSVTVDGRGSSDSDGSLASFAWSWGDGTAAGVGATATHAYASAGSYPLTLTVTDDDGATATTTRSVTVSAPAGPTQPQVLAADAFERSVTGSLGTADVGGPWTVLVGAARQAVAGGGAVLTVGPGNNAGSHLGSVVQTAVDVRTTVSFSRTPANGTGAYAFITGRRVGTALYKARVRVLPTGEVGVALLREVDGVETTLGTVVTLPGFTYTAGVPLQVHLRVTGTGSTSLELTVTPAGSAEPAVPTMVRADSTAGLQAAGSVGLAAYLSGSSTSPVAVRFDDLQVTVPW
jgi:PKD repeat protein